MWGESKTNPHQTPSAGSRNRCWCCSPWTQYPPPESLMFLPLFCTISMWKSCFKCTLEFTSVKIYVVQSSSGWVGWAWGENRLSQFLCWCLLLQGGDIGKSGSLVLQAIPCCLAQGSFAPPLSGSAAHLHLPIQSLSSAGVALQEIFCNNNFWQNFKCVFGAAGRLTAEALWQDDCWLIGWRGNAPRKVFPQMKPYSRCFRL